ncbi:Protein of unknown function UPF0118 [Lachnospiraceae bacterium TWA4]|nr:Protein of unknown function UPF0118 [Lachnospiraceae bacterium TWA4]
MIVATILLIEEKDVLKKKLSTSSFYMQRKILLDNLKETGGNYLKVEGKILLLTTIVCIVGFMILRIENPILKGIGMGIFDALPILGAGIIFVPWAIF